MTKQKMALVEPVVSASSARLEAARIVGQYVQTNVQRKENVYGQKAKARGRDPKAKK